MNRVTREGKKFVTVAAVFQVNPAAIVGAALRNFPVSHQKKTALALFARYFKPRMRQGFVLRCFALIVKIKNLQVAKIDRGTISR